MSLKRQRKNGIPVGLRQPLAMSWRVGYLFAGALVSKPWLNRREARLGPSRSFGLLFGSSKGERPV
jgi:hypothetical protein